MSTPSSPFHIKTEVFEGPLDLLLSLVEKRKLFINDISLAKVADDYIAHVQNMNSGHTGADMSHTAHFILIASTLLLIKSKSLLPTLTLTEDEQSDIVDLERRLVVYARIKELSKHVATAYGATPLFASQKSLQSRRQPVFAPSTELTLGTLYAAICDAFKRIPVKEKLADVVVKKVISLEEMIGNLTQRITSSLSMSFRDFAGVGKMEKVNVIVSFLAMLELVKQGIVHARQEEHFDDILMETDTVGVPRYGNS